jgi:hypothetical protein
MAQFLNQGSGQVGDTGAVNRPDVQYMKNVLLHFIVEHCVVISLNPGLLDF